MRWSRSEPDTLWLTKRPYAHRGLQGTACVENSRAAFEAAIQACFGIEIDVQLTACADAIVFHDYHFNRLTGQEGRVCDFRLTDMGGMRLRGTEESVPSLAEILQLIAGRTPLLIEVKSQRRQVGGLCRAIEYALRSYAGHAAIMSFNPEVCAWFARRSPQRIRGLVVSEQGKGGARGRVERRLALWRAKPHFLAYDIRDLPSRFAAGERKRGLPVLTWTVRNRRQEEVASVYADQIIHELPTIR